MHGTLLLGSGLLLAACLDYKVGGQDTGGDLPPLPPFPWEHPGSVVHPPEDSSSSGACSSLSLPAALAVESPTCTPRGDVDWDLVVEWTSDLTRGVDIAGVLRRPSHPAASVVVASTDPSVPTCLLSGDDGQVESSAPPGLSIAPNNAGIGIPSPGTAPMLVFAQFGAFVPLQIMDLDDWTIIDSTSTVRVIHWGPTFKDIDHDGIADVIADAMSMHLTGEIIAEYPGGDVEAGSYPLVAALHSDDRLEIANEVGIWNARTGAGSLWPTAEWSDESFVQQTIPVLHEGEVLLGLLGAHHFRLTDRTGATRWEVPVTGIAADMALGDTNGDGEPEFCVPTAEALLLLSLDGVIERYWPPGASASFRYGGGCSLADLDADGVYEIVDVSMAGLAILDGRSGEILAFDSTLQHYQSLGAPIVADLDGDGSAEILISGGDLNNTLRAYGPATGRWARTRPVWHQHGYDITSITDDGVINSWPIPSWEAYNAFNAQPAHDGDLPDLQVTSPWACADSCTDGLPDGPVRVAVQVSNAGSQDAPAGAVVRLHTWDPSAADPVLREVASSTLPEPVPATWSLPGFWLEIPAEQWGAAQVLTVDSAPGECDPLNNRVELRLDPCAR